MLDYVALTNSQVDRLGDRLKGAEVVSPEDAALYHEFRAGADDALAVVTTAIRVELALTTSSRLKTLESTVAKLRRQTIKLSQIGDLAGCRFTVDNLVEQDRSVGAVANLFAEHRINDIRETPHAGYRAVHLYVRANGRRIEVQIRTLLQDRWANQCEELARGVGLGLKYGNGPEQIQSPLLVLSERFYRMDLLDKEALADIASAEALAEGGNDGVEFKRLMAAALRRYEEWQTMDADAEAMIDRLESDILGSE